jgi:hypothetical protein
MNNVQLGGVATTAFSYFFAGKRAENRRKIKVFRKKVAKKFYFLQKHCIFAAQT